MADLKVIKEQCNVKNITLKELAKKIGKSEHGLHRMINENSIKVDVLENIARELKVPISIFFNVSFLVNELIQKLEEEIVDLKDDYVYLQRSSDMNIIMLDTFLDELVEVTEKLIKYMEKDDSEENKIQLKFYLDGLINKVKLRDNFRQQSDLLLQKEERKRRRKEYYEHNKIAKRKRKDLYLDSTKNTE